MTVYGYTKTTEKINFPDFITIENYITEEPNEYLKIELLISTMKTNDRLYVHSFGDLGKSNASVVKVLEYAVENDIPIYSFSEGMNTDFHSFYDFLNGMKCVVNMENKRTSDRLQKAQRISRESGTKWGRKASTEDEIYKRAIEEYNKGGYSVPEIIEMYGLKERTFYRKKKLWGDEIVSPESIRNTEN